MADDASLPPQAPLTNGMPLTHGSGEVDASSLQDVCADFHARVANFLSISAEDEVVKRTQEQTRISLDVIAEALNRYAFNELSLSYNGGKDCLVLLILYLSVLHTHFTQPSNRRKQDDIAPFPTTIPSVYVKAPDPFPEVSQFVETSSKAYHLSLTHLTTYYGPNPTSHERSHTTPPSPNSSKHIPRVPSSEKHSSTTPTTTQPQGSTQKGDHAPPKTEPTLPIVTFRDAFALYLAANPQIKAIFVGTRRTDPHGNHLTHFDPTDHKWPDFMRVHPVIDWHLSEIWTFLRSPCFRRRHQAPPKSSSATESHRNQNDEEGSSSTGLEYCSMYDMGYTSLGGINDTLRNPKLRYIDQDGRERYRPAYELLEDLEERLGRE